VRLALYKVCYPHIFGGSARGIARGTSSSRLGEEAPLAIGFPIDEVAEVYLEPAGATAAPHKSSNAEDTSQLVLEILPFFCIEFPDV
jgi:hypothetical protein